MIDKRLLRECEFCGQNWVRNHRKTDADNVATECCSLHLPAYHTAHHLQSRGDVPVHVRTRTIASLLPSPPPPPHIWAINYACVRAALSFRFRSVGFMLCKVHMRRARWRPHERQLHAKVGTLRDAVAIGIRVSPTSPAPGHARTVYSDVMFLDRFATTRLGWQRRIAITTGVAPFHGTLLYILANGRLRSQSDSLRSFLNEDIL